jgi:hypothetical protein
LHTGAADVFELFYTNFLLVCPKAGDEFTLWLCIYV